jgi:hypothetical protein
MLDGLRAQPGTELPGRPLTIDDFDPGMMRDSLPPPETLTQR